ncbi:MAG: hypothetical protein A3E87_06120 [Gammaproteobacteria bacterium RIFCSPHIGHO2_12_FULL_35_23]|nr:MAG: hypothetical protein A3E87_06120 [Gammaproteobacteria bacterium RIFCSPHIGHO2_12_FULL_35_23]
MSLHFIKNNFYPNKVISKDIFNTLFFTFTYSLGYASIMFLPLYLKHSLNYSIRQTGIILSFFGVGFIIGSFYGGKLCDQFSPYKISVISISLYFLGTILAYFIRSPNWIVFLILAALGCTNAAFSPASRIYLMNITPIQDQVKINGLRYMLFNIGCAISYGIAGWITLSDYKEIFILAALSSLVTIIILLSLKQKHKEQKICKLKPKIEFLKEKFLLISLLCFFLGMLVFNQLGSSYSLFLSSQYHFNSHKLAILFVINSLMIGLFQMSIVKLCSRIPQFLLMSIGSIILGIGFFILLFNHLFMIAIISMLIITIGEMLFMPVSYILIFQNARIELRGFYMGVYQTLYATTFILSPLLSSFILAHNPNGLLLWSTSLIICSIPLLCFLFLVKDKL